jgi:hypothetical protein
MNKIGIAKTLRAYRHINGLSGSEVITKLQNMGFKYTVKALYNWESGRSQPDCDTFIALCNIYGIEDILSAFGYGIPDTKEDPIPAYRKTLFDRIKVLDETSCYIISAYIDGLLAKRDLLH